MDLATDSSKADGAITSCHTILEKINSINDIVTKVNNKNIGVWIVKM